MKQAIMTLSTAINEQKSAATALSCLLLAMYKALSKETAERVLLEFEEEVEVAVTMFLDSLTTDSMIAAFEEHTQRIRLALKMRY